MSRTTDSVLTLARRALEAGQAALPAYAHRFAPKKFTQAQLFALLVVRQQMDWTYRATATRLAEWSDLREVLGIDQPPHWTTLSCAHERLLSKKGRVNYWMRRWLAPSDAA